MDGGGVDAGCSYLDENEEECARGGGGEYDDCGWNHDEVEFFFKRPLSRVFFGGGGHRTLFGRR
jgi:hypothetical protein